MRQLDIVVGRILCLATVISGMCLAVPGRDLEARPADSTAVEAPARTAIEVQANIFTGSAQEQAVMDASSDGRTLVVWASRRQESGSYGIYARAFDPLGRPLSDEMHVNQTQRGAQHRPAVAMTPDGNFVVVWESEVSADTDSSGTSIQGQLYAADGSRVNGQFQVHCYTAHDQRHPSVGQEADGGFIVAWRSDGSSGTDTDGASIQRSQGLIFADDFESGDTTLWTSTTMP